MPESRRPRVDLPEPLGPTMASRSPTPQAQVDAVQHVVALAVGEAEVVADQVDAVGQPVAGLAVGPDLGDAEQPARRRGADLEPVDLADQPVERVAQRLDVQDGGGDLAEVDPAAVVGVGADQQGDHARGLEGEVERREEQVAQRHAVALGLGRHLDVVVAGADPHAGQAQRLEGAGALDGLGERGVDPGVRRALGDVALGCAPQVAAHRPGRRWRR